MSQCDQTTGSTLKIIHTSDWHLGHTLHGLSREAEHQAFLDWLAIQLIEEEADALLVAGDHAVARRLRRGLPRRQDCVATRRPGQPWELAWLEALAQTSPDEAVRAVRYRSQYRFTQELLTATPPPPSLWIWPVVSFIEDASRRHTAAPLLLG